MLICMSCSDIQANSLDFTNITFEKKQDSHQNHNDDSCSSFCICNCCGRIVIAEKTVFVLPNSDALKAYNSLKFNYTPHFYSNYFGNIWLPPKLS